MRPSDDSYQPPAPDCAPGTEAISSTPGNPSELRSSNAAQCIGPSGPLLACGIPGASTLSRFYPSALIRAFYACVVSRPGAPALGETAGLTEALRVIDSGADARLCGKSAGGIEVMCLAPVFRFVNTAFSVNGDPDAVTLGHFALCKRTEYWSDPDDPNSPNVLMQVCCAVPRCAGWVNRAAQMRQRPPLCGREGRRLP